MSDKCPKCGAEGLRGLVYPCGARTRRSAPGVTESVGCLRRQLAAANAKLAEMARLAEETRLNVEAIAGVGGWRPIETAPEVGVMVLLWAPSHCRRAVEAHRSNGGKWWSVNGIEVQFPTHWMPLPQPPKEADDGDA